MISSRSHKLGFCCYLLGEDIATPELWDTIVAFLDNAGLSSPRYTITPGLGSRRQFRDSQALLSPDEIRREIVVDDSNSFWVRGESPPLQSLLYSPTPLDGGLQRINIAVTLQDFMPSSWNELASALSKYDQMVLAYSFNQFYSGWQNCNDPSTYQRLYGEIDGFSIVEHGHAPHKSNRLDNSRNPGRGAIVGSLPQRVEAEMWLGPAFWQIAPCTKEEVLAADFFLEIRDTPHFLYLKSWPHPFTRPDGEQGRVQQKLWRLLFHEDCEWPPGSGGISDAPVGGPVELMPELKQAGGMS